MKVKNKKTTSFYIFNVTNFFEGKDLSDVKLLRNNIVAFFKNTIFLLQEKRLKGSSLFYQYCFFFSSRQGQL